MSAQRLLVSTILVAGSGCRESAEAPLGPGTEPSPAAGAAAAPLTFRQVSAGGDHSCGVTTDDRAYCWGPNVYGQLGDGTNTLRLTPVPVLGGLRFRGVSAGTDHTCGVTTDDVAYCWGYNGAGQLGDGTQNSCGAPNPPCTNPETNASRSRPVRVLGGLRFRQVDAGSLHTCGVTRDDAAYCWGSNSTGQLGDAAKGYIGRHLDRPTPVAVQGGLHFRQVSAGGIHTCAVAADDRAYCWGSNRYGQVGDGSDVRTRIRPVLVAGGLRFKQLSAGGSQQTGGHTCAVTTDDRAFCWGEGTKGQIGDGQTSLRLVPRVVAGGLRFRQMTAGRRATCGTTTTNLAYCWGENAWGEVGDGTTMQRVTPVRVSGGLVFRQLSTGDRHTCGTATTNVAYCWGDGAYGAIGDGTRGSRLTPRAVAGAT